MKLFSGILVGSMMMIPAAMAGSNTDVAFVSPAGSDANNCVWHTPFTPPAPPACATATHAATLLKGPGSAIKFMSGTYHEMVSINVSKAHWPSAGSAFRIGIDTAGSAVMFDGGGFIITGDGWVSLRGIRMKNCPSDCITASGISAADPLHGGIENEDIYSSKKHIISMVYTTGFELGYNFFNDPLESHLFVSNSPNYNIHETNLDMSATKTPRLAAYILDSPGGLFDVHIDKWTGPTALSSVNSPHLRANIVDNPAGVEHGNVCPASDIPTDTFASIWAPITSHGCIVP